MAKETSRDALEAYCKKTGKTAPLVTGALAGPIDRASSHGALVELEEKNVMEEKILSRLPRIEKGQKIAFDGDSLTYLRTRPALDQWPWLRITNNDRSWADVFSELLFSWYPHLELQFRNSAIGGSTCRDLSARFDSNDRSPKARLGPADMAQMTRPIRFHWKSLRTRSWIT